MDIWGTDRIASPASFQRAASSIAEEEKLRNIISLLESESKEFRIKIFLTKIIKPLKYLQGTTENQYRLEIDNENYIL